MIIRSKVLLFDNFGSLLLQDPKYDGEAKQFTGYVRNGNWHMTYDVGRKCLATDRGDLFEDVRLVWMGDAYESTWDYNDAIEDAKIRCEVGEPSNYNITQIIGDEIFDEEIPY
jgi:hypothetical protein